MFADAQELIVLSEPMAERVRAHAPQAAHKLSVIPSWADPAQIHPRPKSTNWFAQKHQLHDRFTVLYSGNQGRCHDLVTVMATALLLRHDPDVQFLFIGKGAQHSRLIELTQDWGLSNCLFLPYQELSDLPFTLTVADLALVLLQSSKRALWPLPSSMATGWNTDCCRTPQGSTSLSWLNEDCGRWFANGDADGLAAWILELKANPDQASVYGNNSLRLLKRTATPDIVTAQYLQLIERHLPDQKQLMEINSTAQMP